MSMTIKEYEAALNDPRKVKAANLLVNNDYATKAERRNQDEIAEDAGVTRQTLYNWRTEDVLFVKYMESLSEVRLAQYRSLADAQLINLIRGTSNNGTPSVKGLEMFYKLQGRLTERSEVVQVGEDERKATPVSDEQIEKELSELQSKLKH
ncbi:phBC6A51 family helix-turn-helix protein [Halobacillus seohaensis]|uniref:PhBC6A51 family helix-turn-helix protein n=1 Tax=Halobacillus seohaensis TaxID=447421 RepID=A0ABW2EKC2_9BACI